MNHLFFIIVAISAATLFALFEIQIEGKGGWARNLPTWKKHWHKGPLAVINGFQKPLTGYHFFLFIFIFFLLHSLFLFTPWSLGIELRLISFYLFMVVFEDFLWFAFNPAYGLGKFSKKHVSWHRYWLMGLPIEYYISTGSGFLLYFLSYC